MRWVGTVRGCAAIASVVAAATALTSCNLYNDRPGDPFDRVRNLDLLPRFPQSSDLNAPGKQRGPVSYYGSAGAGGSGGELGTVQGAQRAASGDGYELNFENTPVSTVAKVVLGDIMGLGYTIDPRIQGTVTLASGRPVPRNDLLFVLENALRMSNVVLVRDGQGYRLIPLNEAVGTGVAEAGRDPEAGYGLSVVPLQHVSVPTVMKLLDSFAARPGTVRADTSRNMVIIQGSGSERRSVIETVLTFDADWMRGQSVGIYPVRNSSPEPVIAELEKIMDAADGGLNHSLVKFQAIGRQNAVLVVTKRPQLLRTAATWITRLDSSDTAQNGVRVYRVRYGDARQLAALLNDMFVGRRAGGAVDAASIQLAPGGGTVTFSSERPSLGGGRGAAPAVPAAPVPAAPMAGRPIAAFGGAGGVPGAPGAPPPSDGPADGPAPVPSGGGEGIGGPAILPGVRISADVSNNAVLIFANQENYRIIERTLRQLDRPQMQVAIEAVIAEVVLNNSLNYGVQFFLKSSDIGAGRNKGSLTFSNLSSAVLQRALPGFNFLLGSEAEPRLILDALQSVTDVKVLSTPSLVVVDNQVATLQVGDQVPIATRTAVSVENPTAPVVNNIDYRNTGIILRVAPRVNVNGNIMLDIEQEISNVANTGTADTLTPTVSQRRVKSAISVTSGQTVLLGGLIAERHERGRSGLPLLDKIGPLGEIFGTNSGTLQRTELIIFIRPQIIRDPVDAHRVAEELRTRLGNRYGTFEPVLPRMLPRTPTSAR
jgi:general secretion pathway protein D